VGFLVFFLQATGIKRHVVCEMREAGARKDDHVDGGASFPFEVDS